MIAIICRTAIHAIKFRPWRYDMSTETRQRLIKIIVDSHYRAAGKKLKVGQIADEAGITRQALHRYYGDLVEYIKGDKDVGELLSGHEPDSVNNLLILAQERVIQLEKELSTIEQKHQLKLDSALNKYTTSLMNNDITLFETDSIRTTLEKQTTLISHYVSQIDQLKVQLTKASVSSVNMQLSTTRGSRVTYDPTLKSAFASYKKDGDYRLYLASKKAEIIKQLSKVNEFTAPNMHVIIFIDKYLYDFSSFLDWLPYSDSNEIVIRLPIFDSNELKLYLKKITIPTTISIYIPECVSHAEATAQRKFRAATVPTEEISHAEKSDHLYLFKGIDQITYFSAQSGK